MGDKISYNDAKQAFLESVKQRSSAESVIQKTPVFKSAGLKSVKFNEDSQLRSIHASRLNKQKSNQDQE